MTVRVTLFGSFALILQGSWPRRGDLERRDWRSSISNLRLFRSEAAKPERSEAGSEGATQWAGLREEKAISLEEAPVANAKMARRNPALSGEEAE
jgi:hypothetical protein